MQNNLHFKCIIYKCQYKNSNLQITLNNLILIYNQYKFKKFLIKIIIKYEFYNLNRLHYLWKSMNIYIIEKDTFPLCATFTKNSWNVENTIDLYIPLYIICILERIIIVNDKNITEEYLKLHIKIQ